tara:strand:+ start:226 stop:681 length:456 start_codon:yes stop_codon:yes gene_type:complete
MYIAKVDGNVVGEIVHYTKVFRTIPTDDQLTKRGYKKINKFKPHNNLTERLNPTTPYVSGSYVFTVEVLDMTADEVTNKKDSAMANIRATRDQMLKDTDWSQVSDSTANKSAYAVYRTELRNVPQNMGDADPRTWDDFPTLNLDGASAGGI